MTTNNSPSYVNGDSAIVVLGRPVIVPRADALRLHCAGTALLEGAHGPWPDECEPTYGFDTAYGRTSLTESEALWLANRYAAGDAATEREWHGGRASVDINYGQERAYAAVIGLTSDPNDGQRTKPRKRASDPRERVERQVQRAQRPTTTVGALTTEHFDNAITSYSATPRIPVADPEHTIGSYILVTPDGSAEWHRVVNRPPSKRGQGRKARCHADAIDPTCSACKARERKRRSRERNRELTALLKDAERERNAEQANAREDAKRKRTDAVATSASSWDQDH